MEFSALWLYFYNAPGTPHVSVVGQGGAVVGGSAGITTHAVAVPAPTFTLTSSGGVDWRKFRPRLPKTPQSISLDSMLGMGVGGEALVTTGRGLYRESDDDEILLLLSAA